MALIRTILSKEEYKEAIITLSNIQPIQSFSSAKKKLDEIMDSNDYNKKDLEYDDVLSGDRFDKLKQSVENMHTLETRGSNREEEYPTVLSPIECRPLGIIMVVYARWGSVDSDDMWIRAFSSDGAGSRDRTIDEDIAKKIRTNRDEEGKCADEDFISLCNTFLLNLFIFRAIARKEAVLQARAHESVQIGDLYIELKNGYFFKIIKKTKKFCTIQEISRDKRNKCDFDEAANKFEPFMLTAISYPKEDKKYSYFSPDPDSPSGKKPFRKVISPYESFSVQERICPESTTYFTLIKIPSNDVVWRGFVNKYREDINQQKEVCEIRNKKGADIAARISSEIDEKDYKSQEAKNIALLAKDKYVHNREKAARSPLITLSSQCDLARDKSPNVKRALVLNAAIDEKVKLILAMDNIGGIRRELVRKLNGDTSLELVVLLSSDPQEEIRYALASKLFYLWRLHPDSKEKIFKKIYKSVSEEVQNKMNGLPDIPRSIFNDVVKTHDKDKIASLLRNSVIKEDILKELHSLGIPGLDEHIVHHHNCPTDIIREYLKKGKGPRRKEIYRNPNTPVDFLERAARNSRLDFDNALGLLRNESLSLRAIESLRKNKSIGISLEDNISKLVKEKYYKVIQ